MKLALTRPQWLRLAGFSILLAVVLSALFHAMPGPVAGLASAISDTYYRLNPHAPSKDIVFVAVDHDAVKTIGRWPWQRDVLAKAIDRLDRSAVVALDMVFSEPTQKAHDRALGESFGKATTVGGFFLNGVLPSKPDDATMALLANSALTDVQDIGFVESDVVELSVPDVLAGQAVLATLNTLPDPDERFRHYPTGFKLLGTVQPTLGVQSLQIFLNQQASLRGGKVSTLAFGPRNVQLDRRSFTRLNFYPAERFDVVSFAKLYDPAFDSSRFTGKIVLLGVTEAGVTDIRATPLGQYPGALLHATFMSNVLEGHALTELRTPAMAVVLALALAAALAAILLKQMAARLGIYALLIGGAYGLGALLYLKAFVWLEPAFIMVGVATMAMLVETTLLTSSRQHTEKLRTAFSTYLPPAIVNKIVDAPDKLNLGGEKKEITILFSDIRGFTTMSEAVTAEQLANIMSMYFQPMTEAIFEQGGTLDKYIGDAVMALFNAPLDQPDHAVAACRAAIAMQYAQIRINGTLKAQGLPTIKTGVGVNTGPAVVGNLGSLIRFNYTAIGDAVNLASRLESSTKEAGCDILIGETTHALVKDLLPCKPLGEIAIKGKEKPQTIYELRWKEVADPVTGVRFEASSAA
jgi:adenylate cyclase